MASPALPVTFRYDAELTLPPAAGAVIVKVGLVMSSPRMRTSAVLFSARVLVLLSMK